MKNIFPFMLSTLLNFFVLFIAMPFIMLLGLGGGSVSLPLSILVGTLFIMDMLVAFMFTVLYAGASKSAFYTSSVVSFCLTFVALYFYFTAAI